MNKLRVITAPNVSEVNRVMLRPYWDNFIKIAEMISNDVPEFNTSNKLIKELNTVLHKLEWELIHGCGNRKNH